MANIELDAATTAVILIDLQHGVMKYPTAPHSAASVVKKGAELAERFRRTGSFLRLQT